MESLKKELRSLREAINSLAVRGSMFRVKEDKVGAKREVEASSDKDELVRVAKEAILSGRDPHDAVEKRLGHVDEGEPEEVIPAVEAALRELKSEVREGLWGGFGRKRRGGIFAEEEGEESGERKPEGVKGEEEAEEKLKKILTNLELAEYHLKKFIEHADDPLSFMDDLISEVREFAKKKEAGEPLTRMDYEGLAIVTNSVNSKFGRVYGPFARARDYIYEVADLIGKSKTSPEPGPRKKPIPLSKLSMGGVLNDVVRMAEGLKEGFVEIQEAGAGTLRKVRDAVGVIGTSEVTALLSKEKLEALMKDLGEVVDSLLNFRDLVSHKYYAIWNGIHRRIRELVGRLVEEEGGIRIKEVPWADDSELRDLEERYLSDWMLEGGGKLDALLKELKNAVS